MPATPSTSRTASDGHQAADLAERLPGWRVLEVTDASRGRGVFSTVWRVRADTPSGPSSVVVKLAVEGPNGDAARASGAYDREAWAYENLLRPGTQPTAPFCHLVDRSDPRGPAFVLEDLGSMRMPDQSEGLKTSDAIGLVTALGQLHDRFASSDLDDLPVRRAAPTVFGGATLSAGIEALGRREAEDLVPVFTRMVQRRDELVAAFTAAPATTLCHGDPRADNVAFHADGRVVLFDWQQMAVQLGEADVAWACGTSLAVDDRRRDEAAIVGAYAEHRGLEPNATFERYRLGFVLPGLAVLFLAQRETADAATEQMVANSIRRIGTALTDLDVPALDR